MAVNGADQQHELIGVAQNQRAKYQFNKHPDAQWFRERSNLGLFIHYGISTVHGAIDLSWGMMANKPWENQGGFEYRIAPSLYWGLAPSFNPENYEEGMDRLLGAVKEAGFTYAVFTTKHHDGYALWPSKYGEMNIGRWHEGVDLVRTYADLCRKHGLKVGFYYSPPDWYYHRNYMSFNYDKRELWGMDYEVLESLPKPSEEFEQEYYTYVRDQIRELLTKYGKIDILWFDGGVMGNADEVLSLKEIYELQPGILVNDRMHGDGDFTTTECRLPEEKPGDVWEHCDILSDGGSWGFMYQGRRFKPAQWFYDMYDYCRKMGGNLLMNVGPQDDGTMPETFYKTLEDFKKLLKKV